MPFVARLLCVLVLLVASLGAAPLRVLVVSDTPEFRDWWLRELEARGASCRASSVADEASLSDRDVLLLHRSTFTPLSVEEQKTVLAFAVRGGGIVAVHGAVAAGDEAFGRQVFGGAWTAESRKFSSRMMLYIRPDGGPVGRGASSFDVDDETVYDFALADPIFVVASAFTPKVANTRDGRKTPRSAEEEARAGKVRASIYDIQPQIWTMQGEKHRAAVFLQGAPATWQSAAMRALLLRAAAWTARRDQTDELLPPGAEDTLRYPAGGPLRPQEQVNQFQLPQGFSASVIAAEPLITKPVAVQWDARGRLWVAETPEYPNGRRPPRAPAWKDTGTLDPDQPDRPARDSISILEDTNGDGHMDRKSVFHTGIELVCGFCFHRDGIIVLDYPNISWIRDTDGDGKSDRKEILFGGLPFPNHFILNHLTVSPDGWIYGSSGCAYKPTRPGSSEPVASISPGLFRFRADGSAIEQVGSRGGNSFGMDLTSDLELFQSQATSSNPLQHLVLPEWVVAKSGGSQAGSLASMNPRRPVLRTDLPDRAPVMQIGGVGYYSSACASFVYEGGAWPPEYDRTIWCTEPILDIVHHERMKTDGPAWTGELMLKDREWLRSPDYWFCPVDITAGPDGAMYVLDFYTPVVAHNDTRGPQHGPAGASVRPDREHYFGRIHRIQHEAARELTVPDLAKADVSQLLTAFEHPNRTVRFNAHRVLTERSDAAQAAPALGAVLTGGGENAQVLALWALQRLGLLTADQFQAALSSRHAAVRKNALLAAEEGRRALTAAQAEAALGDGDARVRLAALRALTATGVDAATGAVLARARSSFTDPWSQAAAAAAASTNPAVQLADVFSATGAGAVESARALAGRIVEKADTAAAAEILALAPGAPLGGVAALEVIGSHPPPAPVGETVVAALRSLLTGADRSLAAAALPLAMAWDRGGELKGETAALLKELHTTAAAAGAPPPLRIAAVRALLAVRRSDAAILPALASLLSKKNPDIFFRPLVEALAATGEDAAGRALASVFRGLGAAAREPVFHALAARPLWTAWLLDALEAKTLSPAHFSTLQLASLRTHPDARTAARAVKLLAALGSGGTPAKDQLIAGLLPVVQQPGNAASGRLLFASCLACHRIGGAGVEFGPALDGMGAHPAADLLVHILDPNRSVDDEHRTWHFTMKDGTLHAGLIASENDTAVQLKLPTGLSLELKAADIAKRESSPVSLMPEGLEALGGEALRDIIAYMQSTVTASAPPPSGNFRPLDLSGAFTADNRHGLYASASNKGNNLPFVKLGRVTANGVPFDIADPAAAKDGRTLIVLRADRPGTLAAGYPDKVEIPVGFAARRLHFLGGVAGWGGQKGANVPAMKLTLHYAGGEVQEVLLRAGHEFADYIRRTDVPGSEFAGGIVRERQIRTFAVTASRAEKIEKLVLTSPFTRVAATTVAITAELDGPEGTPPPAPVTRPKGESP